MLVVLVLVLVLVLLTLLSLGHAQNGFFLPRKTRQLDSKAEMRAGHLSPTRVSADSQRFQSSSEVDT